MHLNSGLVSRSLLLLLVSKHIIPAGQHWMPLFLGLVNALLACWRGTVDLKHVTRHHGTGERFYSDHGNDIMQTHRLQADRQTNTRMQKLTVQQISVLFKNCMMRTSPFRIPYLIYILCLSAEIHAKYSVDFGTSASMMLCTFRVSQCVQNSFCKK